MDENQQNTTVVVDNKSVSPSIQKKNNLEKSRSKKFRKRKKPPSDDDDDLDSEKESEIDISLERKLRECAKRNNLSPLEVKKLLRKIVGNDHVLALVKLQEEELNKKESLDSPSKNNMSPFPKDNSTPKLTRAKAKALNKKPVSLPPLNEIVPEPEVTALITEEMHTDEEDDEYEPREEDYIYSEDDFNTTISDLDSQPRTPLTNLSCSEVDSPNKVHPASPKYSSDGVFKIPRERTVSGLTKEDEIIAKRTRSKLCLQTTSIEAIESNFIPPDITKDMYEIDHEIDQEWAQFLNEFTKPLNNTTITEEDDPEDPEYVAADKVPIDAEELKDVNISKKELSDLVAELFDGLIKEGVFLENIPDLEPLRKNPEEISNQRSFMKSPQKKKSKFLVKSQPIFTSPTCERFQNNNFDIPNEAVNSENPIIVDTTITGLLPQSGLNTNGNLFDNQNESVFSPNVMSTPCANTHLLRPSIIPAAEQIVSTQVANKNHININQATYTPMQSVTHVVNSIPPYVRVCPYETNLNYFSGVTPANNVEAQPTNTIVVAEQSKSNDIIKTTTQEQTVTLLAYPSNGGPPCYKTVPISSLSLLTPNSQSNINQQPIIVTLDNPKTAIPSEIIDLTEDVTCVPQPQLHGTSIRTKSGYISHSELYEMWKGDAHKSAEKYYKKFYEKKYNTTLNNIVFANSKQNYDETPTGFTLNQKKLLEQQLRIHVQILAQNFLQTYSHPQFWQTSKSQKDLLLELQDKSCSNDYSVFNAWNLKEAIKLLNEWENELAEKTEENQKFMDFIYHQIERSESNRRPRGNRVIKFPPKTMKKILQSNVFLYPEFLPRLPFVNSNHIDYQDIAPVESHLLAFELEKYLPSIKELIKKEHRKNNAIKLACEEISKDVMTGKSGRRLYDFYKQELSTNNHNPIKYFHNRGKAPPFEHYLIPIDINSVRPPIKRKQQLPMLWKEFANELEASESTQGDHANFSNEITSIRSHEIIRPKIKDRKEQKKERKKERSRESKNRKSSSQNVVINLNYVIDNPTNQHDVIAERVFAANETSNNNNMDAAPMTKLERRLSTTDYSQVFTKVHEPLNIKFGDDASYLQHLNVQYPNSNLENYNFTQNANNVNDAISSNVELQETPTKENSTNIERSGQKLLTDYYSFANDIEIEKIYLPKTISQSNNEQQKHILRQCKIQYRGPRSSLRRCKYGFRSFNITKRLRERKRLRYKLKNLLLRYWKYLHQMCNKYNNIFLKKCFIHFKKIEIYSNFLEALKNVCFKAHFNSDKSLILEGSKTSRIESDITSETTSTTGENFIQIIMPKISDAVYELEEEINANNFFEKVEEKFYKSGNEVKFKKFLAILKLFNPDKNSIFWLYKKMEKIFLPLYKDLSEIFLYFFLPGEASATSHFFRNYMISNKEIFVENLVRYFEQYDKIFPKIYECLNELDRYNLELKTEEIKNKLLLLIDENNFLSEWLQQIFIEENLEESAINCGQTSITFEATDLISNLSELQPSELKYINARLLSVSKIFSPKKLALLASSLINNETIAIVSLDSVECSRNNTSEAKEISNESSIPENRSGREYKFKNIKDLIENINLEERFENDTIISTSQIDKYQQSENSPNNQQDYIEDNLDDIGICLVDNENSTKQLYIESGHKNKNKESTDEINEIINTEINNTSISENQNEKQINEKRIKKSNTISFSNSKQGTKKSLRLSRKLQVSEISNQKTKANQIRNKNEPIQNFNKHNCAFGSNQNNSESNLTITETKLNQINETEHIDTSLNRIPWNKDEDRIILEQASCEFNSNQNLFETLSSKLFNRNVSEIRDRYDFLINLLNKLKSNK